MLNKNNTFMTNCAGCKNPGCYTGNGSEYALLDGSYVLRTPGPVTINNYALHTTSPIAL